jgi:hypothetical protein
MKYCIFLILLFTSWQTYSSELKPFVTDYCTYFLDGTPSKPTLWRDCCIEHDIHYWYGGTIKDRDHTDLKLKYCVEKVAGKTWAHLIYTGVKAGHYSPVKNEHYWGWGWNPKRENQEICKAEEPYIMGEIGKLSLDSELILRYLKNNFKTDKTSQQ